MSPYRARWLRMCVTSTGDLNAEAYRLLTTSVPLRAFLDLEELMVVERDRKLAWELYISAHPEVVKGTA